MNKILKYSIIALTVIAVPLLTACDDDDDDYSPGEAVSGSQVYFSSDADTDIEIDPDASSFSITLLRIDASSSVTVPLTVSGDEGSIYTVPTSVTFESGSGEAELVVTYDADNITYGDYIDITITIDEDYATPYGLDTQTFTVGVTDYGEWQTYNSDGTANYTYTSFFVGDDPDLEFYYRQNFITTNLYQFKICNIRYGVDIVIDYDSETGIAQLSDIYNTLYYYDDYEEYVYVCDYNYYFSEIRGYEAGVDFDEVYGTFDETTGEISIAVVYYISLGYFGADYEYITINGFDNPDVTVSVTYAGRLIDASDEISSVVATVTLGEDVEEAYVALVSEELTQDILDEIIAGTYSTTTTVTASGDVKFDASELIAGSEYTIVAVSFYESEAQEYDYTTFTFSTSGAETWTEIGTGVYTYTAVDLSYYFYGEYYGGIYDDYGSVSATLYQSDMTETRYKISPWASDELIFEMDDEGTITVTDADTGDDFGYGEIYASDIYSIWGDYYYEGSLSYAADGTYIFNLVFYDENYYWAFVQDSFVLDAESDKSLSITTPDVEGKKKIRRLHTQPKQLFRVK